MSPISINPFAAIGLEAWAVILINGRRFQIDIHSVVCTYGVNTIPVCLLEAAIGREVYSNLVSNAAMLRRLVFQIPIEIYVRVTKTAGTEGLLVGANNAVFLLFAGFISNVQFEREESSIHLRLAAVHWLYALNFSSALTQMSHPANPVDLTFNALINMGAGSRGGLTYVDAFQALINPVMLARDMWGSVILPWLVNLTRLPRINPLSFIYPGNDSPSGMCYWALTHFHPTWPGLPVRTRAMESFFVLMNMAEILAGRMADTVSSAGIDLTYTGIAQKTIWRILAEELAPLFFFAVIPLPGMALVVPYLPTSRMYYQPYQYTPYTILTRDVFSVRIQVSLQQLLRAVGVISDFATFTGSAIQDSPDALGQFRDRQHLIGGVYASSFLLEGMVMFKKAPPYFVGVISPWWLGQFLLVGDRRTGRNPGAGRGKPINISRIRRLQNLMMNDLAQLLYNIELTKNRRAEVETALRFDICPGSTIVVEGVGENYLGPEIYQGSQLFGYVEQVTYIISAEPDAARASTIFTLTHLRNGVEQVLDDFTSFRHPLYDSIFLGIPMMNGPL